MRKTATDKKLQTGNVYRFSMVTLLIMATLCQPGCKSKQAIAPDFRLQTVEHGRFYLHAYRGHCVLLLFSQAYCKACVDELIVLKDLIKRYKKNNKEIVAALILRDPENKDVATEKYAGFSITMPVLLDHNQTVNKKYRVKNVPTTVIIDHNGYIVYQREGYSPALFRQIKNKLDVVLEQEK